MDVCEPVGSAHVADVCRVDRLHPYERRGLQRLCGTFVRTARTCAVELRCPSPNKRWKRRAQQHHLDQQITASGRADLKLHSDRIEHVSKAGGSLAGVRSNARLDRSHSRPIRPLCLSVRPTFVHLVATTNPPAVRHMQPNRSDRYPNRPNGGRCRWNGYTEIRCAIQ